MSIRRLIFIAALSGILMPSPSFGQRFDGERQYQIRCASCHGIDGKGSGPVANQLKTAPKDLTRIAKENNGVFPAEELYQIIDGRKIIAVHGTREMPVWGLAAQVSPAMHKERINSIIQYLSSIQQK